MKHCPFCAEAIQDRPSSAATAAASSEARCCRANGTARAQGKMIAGVCAGLAQEFGIAATAGAPGRSCC